MPGPVNFRRRGRPGDDDENESGDTKLLRAVLRIDELASARPGAAYLQHDILFYFDEVRHVRGLGEEASGGESLQRGGIELLAVARAPGARQNGDLARIRMRVRRHLVTGGKFEADRIGAGLRRAAD